MRIGDTIQAGLNAYDPTPYLRAQGNATQSIGGSIAGGVGAIGSAIDRRSEYKSDVKMGKELAKAMKTLYPDIAPTLDPYLAELDNDENPLSHQAALGKGVSTVISQYIGERDNVFERDMREKAYNLNERGVAVSERGMDNEEERQRYDTEALDRALETQTQTEAVVGPAVLDALVAQAQSDKAAGRTGGMSVEQLQAALDSPPAVQLNIAKAAMAMRPEGSELRDVKFMQDGVAMTGTGVYDVRTGKLKVLPVEVPGTAYGDGSGGQFLPENDGSVITVPSTNYSQGAAAGGPDEMQDKWTNQGFSSTGKNLTKGVVAVNESVFPIGTVFRDKDTGEVMIAADRHGNKDPKVVDVYQPPDEYKAEKKNRNLEVIGNVKPATTVEGIQAQIAEFSGKPRVTAGAPIAAPPKPQTETQKKLDEMALAKAEGEIAKEVTTLSGAKTNAEAAIVVMDNLVKHPGFEAAVGSGFSKTVLRQDEAIRGSDRAGAEAMIAQLKGQAFLNAIQQLRGLGALSDAEGAKLQQAAARLDPNQKESDFKAALAEYRAIVQKGVDDAAAILAKKAGSAPAAGSPAPAAGSTAPAATPADAAAKANADRAAKSERLKALQTR
jgi:3D (Asp-Asp-Asp) domain-containing protein